MMENHSILDSVDRTGKMHNVLASAMEHITMGINYVEVKGMANLFQRIKLPDITRP